MLGAIFLKIKQKKIRSFIFVISILHQRFIIWVWDIFISYRIKSNGRLWSYTDSDMDDTYAVVHKVCYAEQSRKFTDVFFFSENWFYCSYISSLHFHWLLYFFMWFEGFKKKFPQFFFWKIRKLKTEKCRSQRVNIYWISSPFETFSHTYNKKLLLASFFFSFR